VENLEKVGRGLSAVTMIHQHSTHLAGLAAQAAAPKPCTTCPKGGMTIIGPETGKVKEWIVFKGLAPPGPMTLWSQAHQETKPFYPDPHTGVWSNTLWFSVPGEYDIIAKSGNLKASTTIKILP